MMIQPRTQSILTVTTLVLFVAAIGVWIINGGVGRIRQATGSHAGGTGAYTETWTAEEILATKKTGTFSNPCFGQNFNCKTGELIPRSAFSEAVVLNFNNQSTSITTPVVTKWTVTGHINP